MIQFNPYLGDKEVHAFPKSITLKVNVITWLEFELYYFKTTAQFFSHYASRGERERARERERKRIDGYKEVSLSF